MAKREKPPLAMVEKAARGLRPLTAYDAEVVFSDPVGTTYDLVKRTKRSPPQLRLYWMMLDRVVKATGKWPNADKLSRNIKLTLGYVEPVVNLRTGEICLSPDSIALDKMEPDEFRTYFDQAVALLSEQLGFDPLAFLEEAA